MAACSNLCIDKSCMLPGVWLCDYICSNQLKTFLSSSAGKAVSTFIWIHVLPSSHSHIRSNSWLVYSLQSDNSKSLDARHVGFPPSLQYRMILSRIDR